MDYVYFTNGQKTLSIAADLIPFCSQRTEEEDNTKEDDDTKEERFCDFDTDRLRAVLNFYRNGGEIQNVDSALRYDLERFVAGGSHEQVVVQVGHQRFFSTKETLSKLPYFARLFEWQSRTEKKAGGKEADEETNIDRDPVLFEEILSRLRHPFFPGGSKKRGRSEIDKELREEMVFWGVFGEAEEKKRRAAEKEGGEEEEGRNKKFTDVDDFESQWVDVALSIHPTKSLFVHNYDRYTAFRTNFLRLQPAAAAAEEKNKIVFEVEQLPIQVDVIGRAYFCLNTWLQTPRDLEKLFDSIEITFARCHSHFTLRFKYSVRLISALRWLDGGTRGFTEHSEDGRLSLLLPMPFPFCYDVGRTISVTENVDTGVKVEICASNYKKIDMLKTRNAEMIFNTYSLTMDERNAIKERGLSEYLMRNCVPLCESINAKRVLQYKTTTPDRPIALTSLLILPFDSLTGSAVPCTLEGTITFFCSDKHQAVYRFDATLNQIAQDMHFKGNGYYSSALWMAREEIGSFSGLPQTQPSGHASFAAATPVEIDLRVITPDEGYNLQSLCFELWMQTLDAIESSEDHLRLIEGPRP